MAKQRLKIIPDRIFHKLWDMAGEYEDQDGFISYYSSDKSLFDYQKYGLSYSECIELLKNIFKLKKTSFREIVDSLELKKSEISHIFCIPIRTVEDWYSEKNRTPSYIILVLLKHFHLFYLGKYVRLESMLIHINTQPSVYTKHISEQDSRDDITISSVIDENNTVKPSRAEEYYDEFISGEEYEKYLDKLIAESKRRRIGS